MSLTLVDEDGRPVSLPGVDKIGVETVLEVGRPPGLAHGTPIDASFQSSLGSLPLEPGRYEWRLEIGGDPFSTSFSVLGPQTSGAQLGAAES